MKIMTLIWELNWFQDKKEGRTDIQLLCDDKHINKNYFILVQFVTKKCTGLEDLED
jgi:hypothetical protein